MKPLLGEISVNNMMGFFSQINWKYFLVSPFIFHKSIETYFFSVGLHCPICPADRQKTASSSV